MYINLLEHATEFTLPINGYTLQLNKRSDIVATHYFVNNTEYTRRKRIDHPDYNSIPENATIIFSNERGANKWQAILQNENIHGFVTEEGGFINWSQRVMHQFDRVLASGCVFDSPEEAIEVALKAIELLADLDRQNVNQLSKESIQKVRSCFEITELMIPTPPEDNLEHLEFVDDKDREDTFFFAAYGDQERTSITVIDLHHCVNYERSDFGVIDDVNFRTAPAAIKYAKEVARLNGLKYELFDSRYHSKFDETDR